MIEAQYDTMLEKKLDDFYVFCGLLGPCGLQVRKRKRQERSRISKSIIYSIMNHPSGVSSDNNANNDSRMELKNEEEKL